MPCCRRLGRYGVRILLALMLPALTPTVRAAPELVELRGLLHRGELDALEAGLAAALAQTPENVDLWLLEAQLAFRRGDAAAARARLEAALARAPDYDDVRLLLARIELYDGRIERARGLLAPLLARREAPEEARILGARIALARGEGERARALLAPILARRSPPAEALLIGGDLAAAAGDRSSARRHYEQLLAFDAYRELAANRLRAQRRERRKLRLSLLSSASGYRGGGREPWREGQFELGWRPREDLEFAARVAHRSRFGHSDLVLGARIARRISEGLALALDADLSPDADFSPRLALRLEVERRLRQSAGPFGAAWLVANGRVARYRRGTVIGFETGVRQFWKDDRHALQLTLIGTRDERGEIDYGLGLRLDLALGERVDLRFATALDRDVEEGRSFSERTFSTAAFVDLRDDLRGFCQFAWAEREHGPARRTLACGFTLRF